MMINSNSGKFVSESKEETVIPASGMARQIERLVALEQELAAIRARASHPDSADIGQMKTLILKQITEIQGLKQVQRKFSEETLKQRNQIDQLTRIAEDQSKQIQTLGVQIQLFQELEGSLRDQQEILGSEAAFLRQEKQSAEDRVRLLESEKKDLETQIQNQAETAGATGEIDPGQVQAMRKREARLQGYAKKLQGGQAKVREVLEGALAEIEVAMRMNPTAELLKVTEYELGRVEIEMKKTPTSSPARRSLEESFEDLIQQRNFLRQVREASEKEAQAKFNRIQEFLNDESLEEIPPLPPMDGI